MLSKYYNLQDHFHDLKTTPQAEFDLSKNIQNIQEAVQSQQAYMTVLSGHINTLCTKLAHLDRQMQIHCIYPHPQSDVIQLNAPDYNPHIDGEPDSVTDIQPSNAKSSKEDISTGTSKSEDHTTIPPVTKGLNISPQKFRQISTATNTTTLNNKEQNIQGITNPNLKTSQN